MVKIWVKEEDWVSVTIYEKQEPYATNIELTEYQYMIIKDVENQFNKWQGFLFEKMKEKKKAERRKEETPLG